MGRSRVGRVVMAIVVVIVLLVFVLGTLLEPLLLTS
jgi:hypothetical protein